MPSLIATNTSRTPSKFSNAKEISALLEFYAAARGLGRLAPQQPAW